MYIHIFRPSSEFWINLFAIVSGNGCWNSYKAGKMAAWVEQPHRDKSELSTQKMKDQWLMGGGKLFQFTKGIIHRRMILPSEYFFTFWIGQPSFLNDFYPNYNMAVN